MAFILEKLLHFVVLVSSVQYCSAYCMGSCWYGNWYIWFSVIMLIAIGCGALGSYLRRRQIQKVMLNQRTQMITVQTNETPLTASSDRPFAYPPGVPGAGPYPGAPPPPGGAPYFPPAGAPSAPSGCPYPQDGAPYPTGYPQHPVGPMTPPPYSDVIDKEEKISALPPSYQDAVRQQGGYVNHGATVPNVNFGPNVQGQENATAGAHST